MDPGTIDTGNVLDDLMGSIPISPGIIPQCLQQAIYSRGTFILLTEGFEFVQGHDLSTNPNNLQNYNKISSENAMKIISIPERRFKSFSF